MEKERFEVLDGWRGISILLVLAAHLMPLGPKAWQLNVAAGLLGMVLFFILSGFLITHFLVNRPNVLEFLIRRFFRILPLAWLYMALVFYFYPVSSGTWWAHFLFYANYPPKPLIAATDHLWSLCLEIHFYIGIALLVGIFKKKGLMIIPLLCIGFTLLRIVNGIHFSVITHFRIDDILAGALLALIYNNKLGHMMQEFMRHGSLVVVAPLLIISCHPDSSFMHYLRPYLAASLVGITLYNRESMLKPLLMNRVLVYIATISYALYVIHPFLMTTWLGSGEGIEKYAKRPLLFLALFISAHISSFYYEKRWIEFGKWILQKLQVRNYGFKESK
jgi:peptidoglycan/LPS O-acetylase OafA/YrhL